MMLAFLPWVSVDEEKSFGDYRILPYVRGVRPAGAETDEQKHIDAVLEPYCINATESVSHAALLTHASRSLVADLGDELAREYWEFSELLAFAALSAREFFEQTYTNREAYRLVIQGFRADSHRVALVSRRRDGTTTNLLSPDRYREIKPHHVGLNRLFVDEPLLNALLRAWEHPIWDALFEGIVSFGLANTDSIQIPAQMEAVHTISAFQRLLDCDSSKSAELLEKFARLTAPSRQGPVGDCPRRSTDPGVTAKLTRSNSIREAWLSDFYALRGNLAHGRLAPSYPSIWNVHEHLLLAAFVFPLLVKSVLAAEGLYVLSAWDRADVDVFEQLASGNHLIGIRGEEAGKDWRGPQLRARILAGLHEETLSRPAGATPAAAK
jgi:hypothetical protein